MKQRCVVQTVTKELPLSNVKAWLQSSVLLSKASLLVESGYAARTDQVAKGFIRAGSKSKQEVRLETS